MNPPDIVDLRPCKDLALRRLPPGHAVREALLAEPDELPWNEAAIEDEVRAADGSRGLPTTVLKRAIDKLRVIGSWYESRQQDEQFDDYVRGFDGADLPW